MAAMDLIEWTRLYMKEHGLDKRDLDKPMKAMISRLYKAACPTLDEMRLIVEGVSK